MGFLIHGNYIKRHRSRDRSLAGVTNRRWCFNGCGAEYGSSLAAWKKYGKNCVFLMMGACSSCFIILPVCDFSCSIKWSFEKTSNWMVPFLGWVVRQSGLLRIWCPHFWSSAMVVLDSQLAVRRAPTLRSQQFGGDICHCRHP